MIENAYPILFDFSSSDQMGDRVQVENAGVIMKRIIERGVEYLRLEGLPVRVEVPVEEDADFMLQHYEDIEDIFESKKPRDIYLFLGDGLLELNTKFRDEQAIVEVVSRPGLSGENKKAVNLFISRGNFLNGWRRAAHDIIAASRP